MVSVGLPMVIAGHHKRALAIGAWLQESGQQPANEKKIARGAWKLRSGWKAYLISGYSLLATSVAASVLGVFLAYHAEDAVYQVRTTSRMRAMSKAGIALTCIAPAMLFPGLILVPLGHVYHDMARKMEKKGKVSAVPLLAPVQGGVVAGIGGVF